MSSTNTENWMKDIGVVDLTGVGGGSTSAATKITALVVDDDSVNQTIHSKMLENLGIQNQVETIFDLILMDMDMPVMNGIEATRKLREMGVRSIIAGVSTCTRDEREQKEFMEAGLDDFQEKPLTTPKLVSILHKLNKKC
ncbi:hypothetical protein I3842_04G107400 [Carya illinoinensis]|uniref:Response regulatory domain-containing protein n=1 Tax=Carya illinoinensis TaxID=32201 RepID=A0A922F7M1_CARIL|nr:hypothetical protein I3842_04G107400 [Carya illinoinensis]